MVGAKLRAIWRNGRHWRWGLLIASALAGAFALVLMFLLAQATGNREVYERNFENLLIVNLVVAVLLLAVIAWLGWRVWQRFRRDRFGSRLLLKLVATFMLVASVPGALIYIVSYQFVTRSIESWFDVRVESALSSGLKLGRTVLDVMAVEVEGKAERAAARIQREELVHAKELVHSLQDEYRVQYMILWNKQGEILASAHVDTAETGAELIAPTADLQRDLETHKIITAIEGLDETGGAENRGVAEAPPANVVSYAWMPHQQWILQVVQQVPPDLVQSALEVQSANEEYQERALARTGMQRMFIGTLTLTLILALLGAVLLAALLGSQLARPLLLLAEGVKQVAEGDLRPKSIYKGNDELGGLTQSFAAMTQQLADARQALTDSVAQLDTARSELQVILDNLSTGVILLDGEGVVQSANPVAARILGVNAADLTGRPLQQVPGCEELAQTVQLQFEGLADQNLEMVLPPQSQEVLDLHLEHKLTSEYWQLTQERNTQGSESLQQDIQTLLLRGAILPDARIQNARLLVVEDVSTLISAQRAQAWGEVARRLAHEIKNPLTPIQLSAERLEIKLMDNLAEPQQAVLKKSVHTIVEQVEAMKRLVNEFRDYARLPAADLQPVDLNALVQDVLQLYGHENATVPVRAELDPECRWIEADALQLRQVLHNLLQNAQDAQEQAGHVQEPVLVQTQWRPATQRVRLTVQDAGAGFPEHILQRAFEPYVTTKAKGTGLGLAVVKKIADDHQARLTVSNRIHDGKVVGAQITLLFPTQGERVDASLASVGKNQQTVV